MKDDEDFLFYSDLKKEKSTNGYNNPWKIKQYDEKQEVEQVAQEISFD